MAKVKGLIKIHGTLDELTFYKTQDGNLVKTKSGVSGTRIATDAAFVRTRENCAEFGTAAQSGKLLRQAIRKLLMIAADNRVTSRVTKAMTLIKDYDTTSARGSRTVGVAISSAAAKQELIGFDFNAKAALATVLYKPYTVNTTTGVITIASVVPTTDIAFPTGATHLSLSGAWAKIDFVDNTSEIEFTNVLNMPINGTSSAVTLTPAAVPSATKGTSLFLLAIEFFQEVNGVQYSLNNGSYNSLAIIEVA